MFHSQYTPPTFMSSSFHCPFCHVFSKQRWQFIFSDQNILPARGGLATRSDKGIFVVSADCCGKTSYWIGETYQNQPQRTNGKMIWPRTSNAEMAHADMPDSIKKDFEEARLVLNDSPRASAALLRLALQKLLSIVAKKEGINEAIAELVSDGLDTKVQEALDYCRIVGNNAVHPGEINLDDSPEIAEILFQMINFIIEELISRPKKYAERFQSLPQGVRDAIKKRDGK